MKSWWEGPESFSCWNIIGKFDWVWLNVSACLTKRWIGDRADTFVTLKNLKDFLEIIFGQLLLSIYYVLGFTYHQNLESLFILYITVWLATVTLCSPLWEGKMPNFDPRQNACLGVLPFPRAYECQKSSPLGPGSANGFYPGYPFLGHCDGTSWKQLLRLEGPEKLPW